MKIQDHPSTKTKSVYSVIADQDEIKHAKDAVLKELSKTIKIDGFRQGKAPDKIVEKNANPQTLQTEVINHEVNDLYSASIDEKKIIPVGQPKISITKFVPYNTLEFKVEVEIIGNLKLADYKKFNLRLEPSPVSDTQLNDSIEELRKRSATYTKVSRPAVKGDRLLIDFDGKDSSSNLALEAASAKDYSLILGSGSFIPGFEEKLIGKKQDDEASFAISFPKDYFDKEYQNRKVDFKVTIKVVEEPSQEKLDDKFAAKMGPFKTLKELKSQLKNELQRENDRLATQNLDTKILDKLADSTESELPETLVEAEINSIKQYDQQTALNNSLTWKEFLKGQSLSQEEYEKKLRPAALRRIKSGLALIEIANKENITVSNDELQQQIELLKSQYPDPKMQEELTKDNVKSDLTKRLLTQKVLEFIKNLN